MEYIISCVDEAIPSKTPISEAMRQKMGLLFVDLSWSLSVGKVAMTGSSNFSSFLPCPELQGLQKVAHDPDLSVSQLMIAQSTGEN